MPNWRVWGLIVTCIAATAVGCGDDETAEATAGPTERPAGDEEPTASEEGAEAAPEAPGGDGLSGTVEGEPFVVRGVLAQRLRGPEIEIRMFDRPVSCESFDADYQLSEDEKVVIVNLEWPKPVGDTVALRASEVHERLQFCHGRASCNPRAPEQGALTVVAASPEGGELSFEVASDEGSLSGNVEFSLCER